MILKRIYNIIVRRNVRLQSAVTERFFAAESTESKDDIIDITAVDEEPKYQDDPKIQEELIKKRNKSRLNPQHRNMLMGIRPYDQSMDWYHDTVKYKRRMLGRYGLNALDEPAGFAWPTQVEVEDMQEYERIAYPLSIQETWKKQEEAKRIKAEQIKAREIEIAEKLAKMEQWTAELNAKIAKKTAELEAARLRKERLVEEVRKHFGYQISPHDEKFKAMLEQKEKEEKKKKKEMRKKAHQEKLTSMIQKMVKETNQEEATESTKSVE